MNLLHRWFCRSHGWDRAIKTEILPWALEGVDLGDRLLEVGPGPGLTTEVLRRQVRHVTAIEIDRGLAGSLARRLSGTNVDVVHGDASRMPFADETFSGAACFTMLHHVPNRALQDRLLREVRRVLRPGAMFAGTDSRTSLVFRLLHVSDTMTLVDPTTLGAGLEQAGFVDVEIALSPHRFRFRARRP
jgi:ubiquinone/menaquinone biosynthesis C-methylase UbiE